MRTAVTVAKTVAFIEILRPARLFLRNGVYLGRIYGFEAAKWPFYPESLL